MPFRTVVEQLQIVNGQRHGQVHGALSEEPTSRFAGGRGRGNIYILVEVTGPERGRDLVAERLAELIRDIYYEQQGSITAALQKAIRDANNMLAAENKQSMPDQQWTAGLSCAVLRNQDLFIAQAGPAAIYADNGGKTVRFPETSPWLDGTRPEHPSTAPLGKRYDVHVDLFHTQAEEKDTFLLVDSGLAGRLPPQAWPRILTRPSVSEVLLELSSEASSSDLSAMVVRLTDERPVQPIAKVATTGDLAAKSPSAPETLPASKAPAPHAEVAASPPPGPPPPTIQEQVSSWGQALHLGDHARSAGRGMAAFGAALQAFLQSMTPSQIKAQSAAQEQVPAGKSPEPKEKRRRSVVAPRRTHGLFVQRLLLTVAIAIPLIVAGLVIWTLVQRGETQQTEVQDLWQSANSSFLQADTLSEPSQVRARLNEADQYLAQLLEEQPDHAEALELRRRIKARLDESSQVRRVPWEGELMTYAPNAKLSRVVVQDAHVFVMDRYNNQVHHHQLDEFQQSLLPASDTVLLQKGDQVGDVLVADLLDLAWMPAGNGRQKAGLLILESGGNLIEYDPVSAELTSLKLATAESWEFPQLIGSHSGRFYLLDSSANHIWRYPPTADGYSSLPDEWLTAEIDLVGVRDMAIGDDIFLLYADGAIQKLSGGRPDLFDISDWDTPPEGATAIFTRPPNETQWLYVADPGLNRIVQASKTGQFRRQLRLAEAPAEGTGNALSSVTSLFVDEIGGRAYFLSGNSLYMIILPSD